MHKDELTFWVQGGILPPQSCEKISMPAVAMRLSALHPTEFFLGKRG
jgi:hypothetical protein